jgi:hypothetical protein
MRYYLLGLFSVLENTPIFQMKSANAILFTGVIFCFREYPLSKCKVQMRYYLLGLCSVLENASPFQMQRTNVTLLPVVI